MIVRDQPVIAGRGGKSGGSGATESRDTLRSTQIAEIMDVISEGECEGLVDGLKSIYLDGVPIQNADGSNNFTGVDIAWQLGTQGQAALPGFDGVKTEFSVGVDVTHAAPVVRTITNPNFDRARVTIAVPQLSSQDTTTGNLSGSSFSWTIEVQSDGGGYVLVHDGALVGKAMSEYTRTVEFDLPGDAPWDIRVSRTSPDSTSSAVVNAFGWSSYTAIQSVKLRYPNTAYTLTRIDAEQFNSVAARSFHWRGLRIRVPTNYNPVTRAYSGTWDGTFKVAYTNNPAWVYFDMATSDRYGLGAFLDESQINKWSLYAIAQYCDALVPDGLGGMEPRFTCNVQIMDRQDAFKTMQQLAEVFRGMAYWAGETLDCFQDSPEEASLLYSPANVVDGNFSYQDSSERGLHSVFICYWTDMAQMGKSVPEAYAPSELIDRYGMRELEMKPLGCTSRGMAARVARWARYTEQMEGESVSFVVGSDGAVAAPGKIFKVADPNVAGERQGGRIIDATLTQVHLDAPVNLAVGETYTISVLQPAGTDHMGYVVEERTVTNVANPAASLINVTPAFSAVPVAGTVWMLQSAGIEPTLWRCLSVEEKQGKNQYQITGVAHNPSKFDAIELGMVLDEPIISRLSADSLPPQNLSLLEVVYTDKTINKTSLTISIVPSATGKRHKFSYRQDNGWWVDLPETSEQTVTLQSIDAGLYDVSVRSYNALGVLSAAISDSITLIGGKAGVRAVSLKSNAITFKVNNSGVSSPAAITLTANVGSLDEDLLQWEVVTGTATLTGTGLSRTLAYADAATDTVTIRASIEQDGETYADTMTLSKVFNGEQGEPGVSGTKYALVSLYQWAPTQPGAPSGQSTFTWATATQSAYTGGNSWVIGMPANPGSAGLRLWAVTLQIAAPGGEAATTVFWSSAAAITAVGLNGAGTQSVEVGIFAWAANLASLPSLAGTATYTWSTQAVSAVPSGWSLTAGTSTSAGLTLFKASVRLQDVTTSASTAIDWSLASISAVGYAGSSGSQGASARIAYAKVTGATIGAGTVTTAGSSSFPPVNSWGRGETWSGTVPAVAADESVMQTNGIYDPATGQTVWGSPYLAVWRVGSLSAITANLGSINAGEMDIGGKFQVSSSGYLVAKGIQIQDEFGNVIMSTKTGAAASLPSSYVTPDGGWLNSNQQWSQVLNRPADDAIRNNLIDVSWWKRGATIPWGLNGEENIMYATNDVGGDGPRGGSDVVWYAREATGDGNAGGGWEATNTLTLDPTKTHRFVVPIKVRDSGLHGYAYWGVQPSTVCDLNGTSAHGNPYFAVGARDSMQSDRWYLFVGFVFPYGSTGNSHAGSGIYDCRTGAVVQSGNNWNHAPGGAAGHRAYQYYAGANATQIFGRPMVNVVDGTEPSLREYFETGAVLNSALVPSIEAAQTAADAAQTTATGAATNASSALSTLATMRSNGYLDASEKPALIKAWQAISDEYGGIYAQGGAYGLGALTTAYYTATANLSSYLASLSPSWSDTTTDTPITPATDQATWAAYYSARQALLSAIADEAAKRAQWGQVSGAGKPQDNATVGATIGANLGGNFNQTTWDVVMAGQTLIRAAHIQQLTSANITVTTLSEVVSDGRTSSSPDPGRIVLTANRVDVIDSSNALRVRLGLL
jgi:predicted phage tail protein